jgi:soluble lytic murein transglycosylase-like protein
VFANCREITIAATTGVMTLPPVKSAIASAMIAAFVAVFALPAAASEQPAGSQPAHVDAKADARTCEDLIATAERQLKVPTQLLHAISIVESGRWNEARNRSEPWPWTVYAQSRGQRFASKAEAIAEIERLQQIGVRNIDVGCMQVNLRYHGKAFSSLDEALNPLLNVAYAARFLRSLYEKTRSWTTAMARYHSATPKHARNYRKKVLAAWRAARKVAYDERRIALADERAARRDKWKREQD